MKNEITFCFSNTISEEFNEHPLRARAWESAREGGSPSKTYKEKRGEQSNEVVWDKFVLGINYASYLVKRNP